MAASTSGRSKRTTTKKRSRWAARLGFIAFSIALLAVAAFLIYQGISGGPLFAGRGSSWTTAITSNKELLQSEGRVPFSADQHLLTALGLIPVIGILPVYLGRSQRGQLILFFAGCVLEVVVLAIIVIVLISWAITGHVYSNYLPRSYPESYPIPIAIALVLLVLFVVGAVFFLRLVRVAGKRRPAVRPWW
ncbi:hypothetical protein BH11ACT2_BH11ACT2_16260 [soil metagenome]